MSHANVNYLFFLMMVMMWSKKVQMKMESTAAVAASVVDMEVITINDGSEMI